MKIFVFLMLSFLFKGALYAQNYFPPNNSTTWDTISPIELGWCNEKIDSLYSLLETNSSKAFILLVDGKIVLEKYFDGHTQSTNWYWASAGKTLTAFMVGVAQQENYLQITDTTSKYLGQGWTNCTPSQEEKITIRNQLTMTTGLNDGVAEVGCTIDTCLEYLADPNTRWAYHNAPYTLLDQVMENATGVSLNQYTTQKLKNATGMDGLYVTVDYNNVFFSTARSMARFGLLVQNKGNWNGTPILSDTTYYNQMTNTSQNLNESYGYLWWLNGKNSFMVPQSQFVVNGPMMPNAPDDMIAALGKNGQFLNVAKSKNMVWIRMGDSPDNSVVPFTFNDDIWKAINNLECEPNSIIENKNKEISFQCFPNPASESFYLTNQFPSKETYYYSIYNQLGALIKEDSFIGNETIVKIDYLEKGLFFIKIRSQNFNQTIKMIKK